ncbi:DNA topoisomerase IB [Pseudoalteromonas sp. S2755]|uniref:DNA topoisomerase IB n=1 Tax=Pseudoalteromonas sp. S2755 TaxID=2066523 RepID=UPI00110AD344|nr:DNA topoisomerase IB [Pseudoalteromonas sp. S2755]TMN32767.1 DNA topoisomerase [Pseudoalteromonas sp. S2755]
MQHSVTGDNVDCKGIQSEFHECNRLEVARKKWGRGFCYLDASNDPIRSKVIKKRIKQLVIPPMWKQVQISACAFDKVQAVGFDSKGKKQYIYHPSYQLIQQQAKFTRMAQFAKQLPQARTRCIEQLKHDNWHQEKVAALAVMVLDSTGIRIGNQHYYQHNDTCGLTTLRRKHLKHNEIGITFEFQGKHGKQRKVDVFDEQLCQFISESAVQTGYGIFRYHCQGRWHDLTSDDVNTQIHTLHGPEFTSKDYRTWVASRLAVQFAFDVAMEVEGSKRKRFDTHLIKRVAKALGNTPKVCRDYYIHPKLLNYLCELSQNQMVPDFSNDFWQLDGSLSDCEAFIVKVLTEEKGEEGTPPPLGT